MGMHAQNVRG